MDRLIHKKKTAERRIHRVRHTVRGTTERPRLAARISNMHVSAQIIDDQKGVTLASATSVGQKIDGNMTAKAQWVGAELSKKAKKAKVSKVVFDRGSHKYHGRLKALADTARKEGLEF